MRHILFVCVQNAGRSQMAEAFFNKLAPEGLRASSAGSRPTEAVHPIVVQAMAEVGIDISRKKPKRLTTNMIEESERIVVMGCGSDVCPALFLPRVDEWELEDPADKPIEKVREIRDEIRRRVKGLIRELSHPPTK